MEIVEITQSDDLMAVARKCAINFRRLATHVEQSVRKQGRINVDGIMEVVRSLADDLAELESTTLPNEVAAQVAAQDIPGQVATQVAAQDIPGQVENAVEEATTPPVGTYVLADSSPSHAGTTWQQVGTVIVTGGGSVPLWHRTN